MKQQVGLGIDIGGTAIKYGLVDLTGRLYYDQKINFNAQVSKSHTQSKIFQITENSLKRAHMLDLEIVSIGIGSPGLVNAEGLILGGALQLVDWENIPLKELMEDVFSLPTAVKNDADMMAIGEASFSGELDSTSIFFTFGTCIGGAMIIKGSLFSGHFGLGGELGFFPMFVNGKVQAWEDLASTQAMINRYQLKSKDKLTSVDGEYILAQYKLKEPLAMDVLGETIRYISMGIAGYISVFNPKTVFIGGGISQAGDFFLELIRSEVPKYTLSPCLENVSIKRATLGNKAGLIGAGLYGLIQQQSKHQT